MQFIPLVLIPVSAALYHLASKSLGGSLGNPWAVLTLTYVLAGAVTLVLAVTLPGYGVVRAVDLRAAIPLALLLGLACVGIEGGYLLAYRLGWNVNPLFSLTSFMSTVAIFAIGVVYFSEALTRPAAVGLCMVLAGLVLVHWK